MKTLHFTARLLSDAVISERAATTGGHRTLDYIPGATLLGAAAAQLYNKDQTASFQLFHSGNVRFGNAYPLSPENKPTLPVPLCWHLPKGAEDSDYKNVRNLIHASKEQFADWDNRGEQQKQLRSGYFSPCAEKITPSKNYRLKTAIDRTRQGMADEAQLFGYQSLAAGTGWYFSIFFDDHLEQQLINQTADAICGTIRVGRSRSAEYGLLAVQRTENPPLQFSPVAGERLILYCLSDLALTDRLTGIPTLIPDPAAHFGLADSSFNAGRSYIRVRSYAPFNSTRKRFDIERQVIVRGSVLVFECSGGYGLDELQQLQQRLAAGIGSYRQDGLGQILVNPPFLAGFDFQPGEVQAVTPPAFASAQPLPPLAGWLAARADERAKEAAVVKEVDGWIRQLVVGPCPRNSQWSQLRTIAMQSKDRSDIEQRLKKLCYEGVSQKQWDKSVKIGDVKMKYSDFVFKTVLSDDSSLSLVSKRLYLLGNRLPRLNNQTGNGGEQ